MILAAPSASIYDKVPGPWTISMTDFRSGSPLTIATRPQLISRQTGDLPRLAKPAAWLKTRFDIIKSTCPSFMRPKYFALVIYTAYKAARKAVVEQCSEFISSGHSFTHDLALAAVQQYGLVKSASIDPSKPVPSLAAGLPHFAAGWARCWGRDVVSSSLLEFTILC
jgi:glycogen debranching enzyme